MAQVDQGSIPEKTLLRLTRIISGSGLQIGGFVGIAHCYLAASKAVTKLTTVDPNISHRGIKRPLDITKRLVASFRLENKSDLIEGYGLEEMAKFEAVNTLFDFVLLDGNHGRDNVLREINAADEILGPGGFLILDDIDCWDGPRSLYDDFPLRNYTKVPLDSRAGVLKKGRSACISL